MSNSYIYRAINDFSCGKLYQLFINNFYWILTSLKWICYDIHTLLVLFPSVLVGGYLRFSE